MLNTEKHNPLGLFITRDWQRMKRLFTIFKLLTLYYYKYVILSLNNSSYTSSIFQIRSQNFTQTVTFLLFSGSSI